jgi:hypothetical protein
MNTIDVIIVQLRTALPSLVDEVSALTETRLGDKPSEPSQRRGVLRHYDQLKGSKALAGDPVAVQRRLRN